MRALVFAVSFLLAFLLFAVQPMATKLVLPVLGGTPAVWNTAMFTFQLLLLLGYLYAHFLTRMVASRWQLGLHALVIVASFSLLPLMVALPASELLVTRPIYYLVLAFLTQVGLPFFCLSATAPLLQSWVSRSGHPLAKTPYVLYSASNLGSFTGLLGYVGIVEPLLDLNQQRMDWSGLYVLGTALLLITGWKLQFGDAPVQASTHTHAPSWRTRLGWIGLAFLPSSLSLGVTTYIATDVASIPLLWVIPLSIYLLSFVDAFRTRPRLVGICQRIAPILGLGAVILYGIGTPAAWHYVMQLVAFAVLAFAIHGWLAARQPQTAHLTQFYVCLSIGGALGGVMNGLAAPMLLREAFEYPVVLLLASVTAFILLQRREDAAITVGQHLRMLAKVCAVLLVLTGLVYGAVLLRDPEISRTLLNGKLLMWSASIAGFLTLAIFRRFVYAFYTCASIGIVMLQAHSSGIVGFETLFKDRNFFGVSRIYESENARYYMHDTTIHGVQSLDPKRALQVFSYYAPLTDVFRSLPISRGKPIGIVGLGIGTLKCLAHAQQQVDMYEINPMAEALAEDARYFTYLRDCPGTHRVLLGDGRVRIAEQQSQRYGVIVLDAFSSDAIPGHLLTKEAFAVYLDKLAPHGVLLLNATNRHIDLRPLIAAQAETLGLVAYSKAFRTDGEEPLRFNSVWVAVARTPEDFQSVMKATGAWTQLQPEGDRPWTDKYINLLPYFHALRR